jgi:hypothetical protein
VPRPEYIAKADVVAMLRSRQLDSRAEWVDRTLPEFVDVSKNSTLLRTLGIDPTTMPHVDPALE